MISNITAGGGFLSPYESDIELETSGGCIHRVSIMTQLPWQINSSATLNLTPPAPDPKQIERTLARTSIFKALNDNQILHWLKE